MADVTVSYKGSNIVELDDSATKVLTTSGKYCEDDITIDYAKPSGGGSYGDNEVIFYDYDGTIVYSCTIAEAHNLTELPTPPEHEGLVFQEWNWTLQEVKNTNHIMDIGALYDTIEDRTEIINGVETTYKAHPLRVYIDIFEPAKQISLLLSPTNLDDVVVDFGDNTPEQSLSSILSGGATTHIYTQAGKYCIKIFATPNNFTIDESNNSIITRKMDCNSVSIDRGFIVLGDISSRVSGQLLVNKINSSSLVNYFDGRGASSCLCKAASIEKNNTFTVFASTTNVYFGFCNYLTCPKNTDYFTIWKAMKRVSLPKTLTTLYIPNQCLLDRLIYPDNIVAHSFYNKIGGSVGLYYFSSATTSIPTNQFLQIASVKTVIYAGDITEINIQAFRLASNLCTIDLSNCTSVPVLSNINSFDGISNACEILIPSALKQDFINDTNWATLSSHFVEV